MAGQTTIENEISYSGVALHSGKEVKLTIKPAEANKGFTSCARTCPPVLWFLPAGSGSGV